MIGAALELLKPCQQIVSALFTITLFKLNFKELQLTIETVDPASHPQVIYGRENPDQRIAYTNYWDH